MAAPFTHARRLSRLVDPRHWVGRVSRESSVLDSRSPHLPRLASPRWPALALEFGGNANKRSGPGSCTQLAHMHSTLNRLRLGSLFRLLAP